MRSAYFHCILCHISIVCMYVWYVYIKRSIIAVGDNNVHLDDPTAPQVGPFLDLLSNFGLSECIRQPSHSLGHQLDVLITPTDQPASAVRVDPPLLLSDHSLRSSGPGQPVVTDLTRVQRRCWKMFDVDGFTADLLESDHHHHIRLFVTWQNACHYMCSLSVNKNVNIS